MFSMFVVAREGAAYVSSVQVERKQKACVVIDAGHGGSDPGKVGINDQLEKDLNLKIAMLLKDFLQAEGISVVMTRESDQGLYDEGASNKKVQDMKRRLEIIEQADPEIVVSIHQNSYHEEYVKGAQVFYYTTSENSKALAEVIQDQLRVLDPDNRREAKGNDSYFLLKEAEKLATPLYQERLAWNIHMGIMKYLNGRD